MQRRSTNKTLPIGRQLREARLSARLKIKELAHKAKVSMAAVYNCERHESGGRTRTLLRLAKVLGLKLRIPDVAALMKARGLTEAKLAEKAEVAFGTVRALLAQPLSGNVKPLEKICAALGHPITLVI